MRTGARTRSRQFYFECLKFTENPEIEEFSVYMSLARAHKKLLNLDKTRDFKENRNL